MQGIDEFLTELRHRGVQLWAEGDRLRYRALKETLTPDLLQGLRERKTEILEFLQEANVPAPEVSLVPIQKHGSKPPLFCIYGIFVYYDLARHLGEDQPVYGVYIQDEVDLLQERLPEKQSIKPISVVNLATRYLQEIRKQQPVGPYLLAGLSFGGLVAFEIAQQLRRQGEDVALLALFDTYEPGEYGELSIRQKLSLHLKSYRQHGQSYILEKVKRRVYVERKKISNLLNHVHPSLSLGHAGESQGSANLKTLLFSQASATYQPEAYPGKIILFHALYDSNFRPSAEGAAGWQQLAMGGLEVHEIPGDHFSILKEPHVGQLAQTLTMAIDGALGVRAAAITQRKSLNPVRTSIGVNLQPPDLQLISG
jgi:thioesterase domain-containing protein